MNNNILKVFIGADQSSLIPASVHAASIWRSLAQRCAVEIYIMVGDTGELLFWSQGKLSDAGSLPLTPENRPASSGTGFSLLRFAIPELVNNTGRAIYCDSDQVCLGDFLELALLDLGTAGIACAHARANLNLPADALETSVMVIDAAKCNWNVADMLEGLNNGTYTYKELTRLYGRANIWRPDHVRVLSDNWNFMNDYCPETKLIHYTERKQQPWKNDLLPSQPARHLWEWALRHEIKNNFIDKDQVLAAIDKGYLKPSLLPLCNGTVVKDKRLTVVIEAETSDLAPQSRVNENIDEILRQLESIADAEALIVSNLPLETNFRNIRNIVVPNAGYYAFKNAGFAYARGAIVQFIDADCCPETGYLNRILAEFDADPDLRCLTGCTRYRKHGFLSRLNTTLSFGYLHQPGLKTPEPYAALSHNLAIRAETAPAIPFGPNDGRVGGDRYLTNWFRDRGHPIKLNQQLIIQHEDPSRSIPLLLDRHLREHFKHAQYLGEHLGFSTETGRKALASAWSSWQRRRRKVKQYGAALGLSRADKGLTDIVIGLYWLLDVSAVAAVLAIPVLKNRWLSYQNGRSR